MTPKLISQIEDRLQYTFVNKELLVSAFTHSSYANEINVQDNERMEFLGDAILGMVVSEYLYDKFVDSKVGLLSAMRSNIVSAEGLRPIVNSLDIVRCLQVGHGATDIVNQSQKIESSLYEAIVAAIYLDGGIDEAKRFITRTLETSLSSLNIYDCMDCVSTLKIIRDKSHKSQPVYDLIKSGPDHKPIFTCYLRIDDKIVSEGNGHNTSEARQDAARKYLKTISQ